MTYLIISFGCFLLLLFLCSFVAFYQTRRPYLHLFKRRCPRYVILFYPFSISNAIPWAESYLYPGLNSFFKGLLHLGVSPI